MEGVAAPTSEDSLEREAQGGAKRYVSRHQMSPNAWSSPTLRPSAEAEFISSASVLSPHKSLQQVLGSSLALTRSLAVLL